MKKTTGKKDAAVRLLPLLHGTLLFLPALPVVFRGSYITQEERAWLLLLGAAVGVPVLLSALAARYCKSLAMYAAAAAVTVFAAYAVTKRASFATVTLLLFVIRFQARLREGRRRQAYLEMPLGQGTEPLPEDTRLPAFIDEPKALHFLFFVFYEMTALIRREEDMYTIIFYVFFADVIVCFLFRWLGGFWEYLEAHRSVADLPVQTMKKTRNLLLVPALLLLMLAALPAFFYGKEPLAELELRPLPHIDKEVPTPSAPPSNEGTIQNMEAVWEEEAREPSPLAIWLQRLLDMLAWVISIGVIVGLAVAAFRALRMVSRSFYGVSDEDEITFLEKEEKAEKLAGRRKKRRFSFFLTPEEQIRRKYKKTVQRSLAAQKKHAKGSETPAELEMLGAWKQGEAAQTLHRLYEKARYSQQSCSEEEAREAEKLNAE